MSLTFISEESRSIYNKQTIESYKIMIWLIFRHIKYLLIKAWKAGMSSEEYVKYLRKHGVRIGEKVNFRDPLHTTIDITRPCLVEIGDNLDINSNFTIMTHDFSTFVFRSYFNDFVNSSGKVKIGSNIVFGRNVTILKGVTIGDNCIIGAGSIISKSIPANSVAVGSPAKVVCSIEEYYNKRKKLQVQEALEYGKELAMVRGGIENLKINDFVEEWVLFLSESEYEKCKEMQQIVDFRLKGRVQVSEFLNRPRPYSDFASFIEGINNEMK